MDELNTNTTTIDALSAIQAARQGCADAARAATELARRATDHEATDAAGLVLAGIGTALVALATAERELGMREARAG